MAKKRGRNYSKGVRDTAHQLFLRGMRSTTIAKQLPEIFPRAKRLPDDRLIRTWMEQWRDDQSGPWQMEDQGDPAILLHVLRTLIVATQGKVTDLTASEAEELTRLGHSTPGMPPIGMYNWARAIIAARIADEPVTSLVHYLAFTPWTDEGKDYVAAFNAGYITELRALCPGDEAWLGMGATRSRRTRSLGADAVIVER